MPSAQKPDWLRVRIPSGEGYARLHALIRSQRLHTVCDEARCPNVAECWGVHGTATIMLMGDVCTRACRFCAVTSGNPAPLDPGEPERVARSISAIGLRYAVLTSVCRDDLEDGGASHIAGTVSAIKRLSPGTVVEVLIPDFEGSRESLGTVIGSGPDVIGHNVETVERLTPKLRDRRASYRSSLEVLSWLHANGNGALVKSSLMLGLGETDEDIDAVLRDLRTAEVDILTIGQYLQPSKRHHPVVEYVHPDRFGSLRQKALSLGFSFVASGPLVRSSYHASEAFALSATRAKVRGRG